MGMRPIVVDTGDSKRELSLRMGAEAFIDFRETEDPVKSVIETSDGVGVHSIFVTAPAAYKNACWSADWGCCYVYWNASFWFGDSRGRSL